MTTIDDGTSILTLINVFTVEPERQEELVTMLERATQETMRHLPGFISANIHRSLDKKRVVNYAQWRDRAAFDAMLSTPAAQEHMRAIAAFARFDPILCEVASVHPRS